VAVWGFDPHGDRTCRASWGLGVRVPLAPPIRQATRHLSMPLTSWFAGWMALPVAVIPHLRMLRWRRANARPGLSARDVSIPVRCLASGEPRVVGHREAGRVYHQPDHWGSRLSKSARSLLRWFSEGCCPGVWTCRPVQSVSMEQTDRRRAARVKRAVANERLEGLVVSEDAKRIADSYVVGKASAREAAAKIRARYGIPAR